MARTDVKIRPASPYRIKYSLTADRASAADLNEARVTQAIHVFISPETNVVSVNWIKAPSPDFSRLDSSSPFDLIGNAGGSALPFDAAVDLAEGRYMVAAVIATATNTYSEVAFFDVGPVDDPLPAKVSGTATIPTPSVSSVTTVVSLTVAATATTSVTASAVSGGSGTFKQGAFQSTVSSGVVSFGTTTGTTPRVGMVFTSDPPNLMTASDLTDWQNWLLADSRRLFILSVYPLPNNATYKKAWSNTSFDASHTSLAANLASRGMASRTIIRLAWECNGSWFSWGPSTTNNPTANGDGAGYISMFRRMAAIYRAQGLRINWNLNGFPSSTIADGFYPGNDVVDVISMDLYDAFVASTDPTVRWNAIVPNHTRHRDYAATKGKQISLDEWGCWTSASNQGGGDNPAYIDHVADFIAANSSFMYATYFNNSGGGPGVTLSTLPNAKARYGARFAGYTS